MKTHRNFVAKKVKPYVTDEVLKSLKEDLKIKNWKESGSGEWTSKNISVRQIDVNYFDIEIERQFP